VWILNFKLLPSIQNNLDWHENFTTITRLKGEQSPNFIYWKLTFDEKDISPQSCSHHNAMWWTQIEPVNLEWLSKTHYILDWFEKFTIGTRLVCATFPTSLIEFGHQMQKLQHFELDCLTVWGHFWTPWAVRVKKKKILIFFLQQDEKLSFHF